MFARRALFTALATLLAVGTAEATTTTSKHAPKKPLKTHATKVAPHRRPAQKLAKR